MSYDAWLSDNDAYRDWLQNHPESLEFENDTHYSTCFYLSQGGDCTCATIDGIQAHFRNLERESRGDV